jgi:hypothetical protein
MSDRRFVSHGVGAVGPTSTGSLRRTVNASVVVVMAGAWTCSVLTWENPNSNRMKFSSVLCAIQRCMPRYARLVDAVQCGHIVSKFGQNYQSEDAWLVSIDF